MRGELEKNGRKVFGNPCAILPVFIGNEIVSRLVSRLMMDMGTFLFNFRCSCQWHLIPRCQDRPSQTQSQHNATAHKITFGYFCESFREGLGKSYPYFRKTNENISRTIERGTNGKTLKSFYIYLSQKFINLCVKSDFYSLEI